MALLPLAQQAAPYIDKAWRWMGTNAPGVREAILRGGIAKGTQWFGNRLFGGTPETEEYQKRLQEQMRLIGDQIRRPGATPVGQAIQRTIKQQGKQAQQALAKSAAPRGQTGTSPSRASQMQQLGREAGQQATAMAQLSASGQQQYNQLLAGQERLAQEERSALSEIMGFIMKGAAEAATKKLLADTLQDAWEASPETMGTPAATTQTQGITPEPVQGGYLPSDTWQPAPAYGPPVSETSPQQPVQQIPTIDELTPQELSRYPGWQPEVTPSAERRQWGPAQTAQELRAPTPITTPAPNREEVQYPSSLIQRTPMTAQQPGENIPQQAGLGAGLSDIQSNALGGILTAPDTELAIENALQYLSRLRLIYELTSATNINLPPSELQKAYAAIELLQKMPPAGEAEEVQLPISRAIRMRSGGYTPTQTY